MREALQMNQLNGGGIATPDGSVLKLGVVPLASSPNVPPRIDPLPDGIARPFWSVMIPVYNCPPDYLRETLQSVLVQDPGAGEMQIEVIDNCSTDSDPQALVQEIGAGRIGFHRQPRNVGIVENFNTCIRRAEGHWVHILHGDDTVRPGYYARARRGAEQHPEVGALLCRPIYIDEDGQWMGLADVEARIPGVLDKDFAIRQLIDQRIYFVSIVVRRSTYEQLGGFRASLMHCLDWDMWKRVAMRKPIFYDPEPLACFRLHAGADSSRLVQTGENVVDERRSIEFSCADDIPPEQASFVRRAANKAAGVRAARRARSLWKAGNRTAAWRQVSQAMRCSLGPAVLAQVAYFLVRIVVH